MRENTMKELIELKKQYGASNKYIAFKSEIDTSYISRVFSGKISNPNILILNKIAAVFGKEISINLINIAQKQDNNTEQQK